MKSLFVFAATFLLAFTTAQLAMACTLPAAPSRSADDETQLLQQTGFLLVEEDGRKYSPAAMIDYDANTILEAIINLERQNSAAHKGIIFHLRVAGLGLRDTAQVNCFFDALYRPDELRLINDMLIMSRQLERDRNALPIAKALIRLTDRASGAQVLTVLQEIGVLQFPETFEGQADMTAKPALHRAKASHLPNLIMRALATRLYKDSDTAHAIVYAIAGMGYRHR